MDSFEARLQFIQILKNLQKTLNVTRDTSLTTNIATATTATTSNGTKLADPLLFYLKWYEQHYEDFYQCMFTTALKMDPLDRLNIIVYYQMIVISLWPLSKSENPGNSLPSKVLFENLLPSMDKILELALPANEWKSLVNLRKCIEVFKFINKLCENIIEESAMETITQKLQSSEVDDTNLDNMTWYTVPIGEPKTHNGETNYKEAFQTSLALLIDRVEKQQLFYHCFENNAKLDLITSPNSTSSQTTLHRMESDRERHKRSKERTWFIDRTCNTMLDKTEFEKIWLQTTANLSKEDYNNIQELDTIAGQSYMISPDLR